MDRSSSDLIEGQVYFVLMYQDENFTIPVIQTLIYQRAGQRDDGSRYFLFREIPMSGEESDFLIEEEHLAQLVLDRAALISKLLK